MSTGLPFDEAAERAVLGACMESVDAYRSARSIVGREDFYPEQHQIVWDAIGHWVELGAAPDVTLVFDRVRELKLTGKVSGVLLHSMVQAAPITLQVPFHARVVAQVATRRRLIQVAQRMIQRAETGEGDVTDLVESGLEDLRHARDARAGVGLQRQTLAEFLAEAPARPDWVLPGLLARGDRLVLTGPGGLGKSTLALQCVVLGAAGLPVLDWYQADPVRPVRASVFDCENPKHRVNMRIRPMLDECAAVGQPVEDRIFLGGEGRSLNLFDPSTALGALRAVENEKPDLIYIGPFYKLHNEDPDRETTVKKVTHVLDQMREINGAALIMEAHHNKTANLGGSLAPSGSNMWNWWPELGFGLRLDPQSDDQVRRCALERWRIDRDAFDWPRFIEHGGRFPWASSRPNPYYGLGVAS